MSISAGARLGPYRVLALIGAGGMGRVVLAEDTRLNRKVAIKLLPADLTEDARAKQRLLNEARAAAAIDHPNVCAVYDVGEFDGVVFIAMQYVEGETLAARLARGRVPVPEALEIAIQIAKAVGEAHNRGIIHRDLKPQNVMLSARGEVKVLDFGLAKDFAPVSNEAVTEEQVPHSGTLVGTIPYMSPEQLHCEVLDPRSDIFSFGVLLYELLSGQRPFKDGVMADLIVAILSAEPAKLQNVPPSLAQIVERCLRKQRHARYSSVEDLLADLGKTRQKMESRESAVGLKPPRRSRFIDSVAVLPFENAIEDPQSDYLVDGISESIIHRLSEFPRLRVMGRSTVFRFRGKSVDPLDTGRQLGVRSVLSGRIGGRGDRLVVETELIDTRDGARLWGERYNRQLSQLVETQEEIASAISEYLRIQLSPRQKNRLAKPQAVNPEAYRLYLLGRFWWNKRPQEGFMKGLEFFQQAIECDPLFPLAYAGLSDAYAVLGSWEAGLMPPREAMPRAKAAAHRALELDDQLADAYASLGYIFLHYDWNWDESRKAFTRAIELNPNCINAHHWLSHLHVARREADDSLHESRKTSDLDPLDLIANVHLAWHYWLAREPERVIQQACRTADLEPKSFWPLFFEGLGYELKSEWAPAVERFREAHARVPATTFPTAALAHALGSSGARSDALKMLDELEVIASSRYVPAYDRAIIHLGAGNIDLAFDWLDRTFEERSGWLAYLLVEPRLDSIRSHSRFADLCDRVGVA